ncbi:MAG: RMD1 family protein [Magnetococcus sp. WYHC-3]
MGDNRAFGPGVIHVRARLLGQRLKIQGGDADAAHWSPPVMDNPAGGMAVLFRFGAVVAFSRESPPIMEPLESQLAPRVESPVQENCEERLTLVVDPDAPEGFYGGNLRLRQADINHLVLVADILAKCVLLSSYEGQTQQFLEALDPLVTPMRQRGRLPHGKGRLMRQIGESLQLQHRMVGMAQIGDKPELLWERPELERLFVRMEREYEIRERQGVLDRKLGLIQNTARTFLDLLEARHNLALEWAIVILIVVEILMFLPEHL